MESFSATVSAHQFKRELIYSEDNLNRIEDLYVELSDSALFKQEQYSHDYQHWQAIELQYTAHIKAMHEYIADLKANFEIQMQRHSRELNDSSVHADDNDDADSNRRDRDGSEPEPEPEPDSKTNSGESVSNFNTIQQSRLQEISEKHYSEITEALIALKLKHQKENNELQATVRAVLEQFTNHYQTIVDENKELLMENQQLRDDIINANANANSNDDDDANGSEFMVVTENDFENEKGIENEMGMENEMENKMENENDNVGGHGSGSDSSELTNESEHGRDLIAKLRNEIRHLKEDMQNMEHHQMSNVEEIFKLSSLSTKNNDLLLSELNEVSSQIRAEHSYELIMPSGSEEDVDADADAEAEADSNQNRNDDNINENGTGNENENENNDEMVEVEVVEEVYEEYDLDALLDQISDLSQHNIELEDQLKAMTKEKDEIESELADNLESMVSMNRHAATAIDTSMMEALQMSVEQLEASIAKKDKQLLIEKHKTFETLDSFRVLQEQYDIMKEELLDARASKSHVGYIKNDRISQLEQFIADLNDQKDEMSDQLLHANDTLAKSKHVIRDLRSEVNDLESELESVSLEWEQLKEANIALEFAQAQQQQRHRRESIAQIQEHLEQQQQQQQQRQQQQRSRPRTNTVAGDSLQQPQQQPSASASASASTAVAIAENYAHYDDYDEVEDQKIEEFSQMQGTNQDMEQSLDSLTQQLQKHKDKNEDFFRDMYNDKLLGKEHEFENAMSAKNEELNGLKSVLNEKELQYAQKEIEVARDIRLLNEQCEEMTIENNRLQDSMRAVNVSVVDVREQMELCIASKLKLIHSTNKEMDALRNLIRLLHTQLLLFKRNNPHLNVDHADDELRNVDPYPDFFVNKALSFVQQT